MRTVLVKHLTDILSKDKKSILLTSDMGFGVLENIQFKFPKQFINTGVAEANTAGIAAGLALSGYTVFFYAQAAFATMRCFEQVRLDIASHNLNVKIIGTSAGFSLSQYGTSHYSIEDIALMRLLPNMKIFCPGDLYEVKAALRLAYKSKGPAYIRIGKTNNGNDQYIHRIKSNIKIGKAIVIKKGEDAALMATGSMLFRAREVIDLLKSKIDVALISVPIIKPIDKELICDIVAKKIPIFTLEEHSIIGGLGSAVAEVVADSGNGRVIRMGINDRFLHITGSRDYLLSRYSLSAKQIAKKILYLSGNKLCH